MITQRWSVERVGRLTRSPYPRRRHYRAIGLRRPAILMIVEISPRRWVAFAPHDGSFPHVDGTSLIRCLSVAERQLKAHTVRTP